MSKVTVRANTDIALIKYWGKKDKALRLPENNSLSIILDGLHTTTTVEFSSQYHDQVIIQGRPVKKRERQRVIKHVNRLRTIADLDTPVKIVSSNNFPRSTGLSSSGSGFAALTYAVLAACNIDLTEKEISILARQASGTACRCVCGGFVEWLSGESSDTSYAYTYQPSQYWDVRDVVAIVGEETKSTSSTSGHIGARTSPFFTMRQQNITQKIDQVKQAIDDKDFTKLGTLVEAEALEFHSILFTSQPSLIMWYPGTLQVMHEVRNMRAAGIEAYFTINTGFNIHVLTLPKYQEKVQQSLDSLKLVQSTHTASVGNKPKIIQDHLF